MTEHLPECPCIDKAAHPDGCLCCEVASPCICDRLRACEERVQKIAYQQGLGAGSDEHGQHEIGWIKGYDAALDDAREALFGAKAIDVYYGRGLDEPPQFIWLNNALSAIDALREDQP